MHADALLSALAQTLHLPGLAWSEAGTAALLVDGVLPLNLERDDAVGQLLAWVPLGELPADGREALLTRALEHNLLTRGSSSVGYDRSRNELLAMQSLHLDGVDALAFEAALVALVDSARSLRAEFASAASAPANPSAAPASWQPPTEDPRTLNWMLRA